MSICNGFRDIEVGKITFSDFAVSVSVSPTHPFCNGHISS